MYNLTAEFLVKEIKLNTSEAVFFTFNISFMTFIDLLFSKQESLLLSFTNINLWNNFILSFFKREGVTVKTVNEDLATREGCINLLQEANILGPVDAIFNIAVTLKDDAFKNQTEESFQVPFVSKVMITRNLDEVSRNMCPKLRYYFGKLSVQLQNMTLQTFRCVFLDGKWKRK